MEDLKTPSSFDYCSKTRTQDRIDFFSPIDGKLQGSAGTILSRDAQVFEDLVCIRADRDPVSFSATPTDWMFKVATINKQVDGEIVKKTDYSTPNKSCVDTDLAVHRAAGHLCDNYYDQSSSTYNCATNE